jgi:lysophospholipase L1-like esterase
MVMPNLPFGAGLIGAASAVIAMTSYAADHAAFGVSDYCLVSQTAARKRFSRPTVDGQGFEHATPGARVRFKTNSRRVDIKLDYTALITRLDAYNGVMLLLADGVQIATIDRVAGVSSAVMSADLGSTADRVFEIVWPYCASVDFTGVDLAVGATLTAAPARTSVRYVAVGDSITHGSSVPDIGQSWPYKLAVGKSWQLINHGYGGRGASAADGAAAAALNPSVATYMIGYNNFYPQTPLAAFKTEIAGFMTQFRATGCTAKLYLITPLWSPTYPNNAITIEQYRQAVREAVAASGNPLNILIEGPSLTTQSLASFPDGVHPNAPGAAEITTALQSIVTL